MECLLVKELSRTCDDLEETVSFYQTQIELCKKMKDELGSCGEVDDQNVPDECRFEWNLRGVRETQRRELEANREHAFSGEWYLRIRN